MVNSIGRPRDPLEPLQAATQDPHLQALEVDDDVGEFGHPEPVAYPRDLRYDAAMNGLPPDAESLRQLLKPLWDRGEFRLIVLFGSMAKGSGGPSSDVDLGLLPRETMDEIQVTAEVIRLTHCNDVDLVDLTRADPLTAMEVARAGQILFCEDPSVFTEFRSLAFRRYVDAEKLRKAQRRALDLFEKGS